MIQKLFITLGIIAFILLLAIIGLAQVPISQWLNKVALPPQITIEEPKGNIFSGGALLTIDANQITQQLLLRWNYCPAGLNGWFPSTISMWCVTAEEEKLSVMTEISLFDLKHHQQHRGLSLTNALVSLSDYSPDHKLYGNMSVSADWSIEQLQVDFNQQGLHRIYRLVSASDAVSVKMFDINIDNGTLQLNKAVGDSIKGHFSGSLLDAKLISQDNGELNVDAKIKQATGPIYALLSLYLDDNDEYHFRGRWY